MCKSPKFTTCIITVPYSKDVIALVTNNNPVWLELIDRLEPHCKHVRSLSRHYMIFYLTNLTNFLFDFRLYKVTCKPKWAGCDWHFMLVGNNLMYCATCTHVTIIKNIYLSIYIHDIHAGSGTLLHTHLVMINFNQRNQNDNCYQFRNYVQIHNS